MRTVWLQRALTQAEIAQMRQLSAPHQLRWWQTPTGTYFHTFQVGLIYGSIIDGTFLCNDHTQCTLRDKWALRNTKITHALDGSFAALSVPSQFLQEYYVRSGASTLYAPRDVRANDLILCEFPSAPTPMMC